ncbi:helix-turn-helix transcriptional regulator [Pectinatus haikarae]|uniref:AraC-like DNA-binding protein n=1 Tax=Pectinatus haikarae TaxID=349096 RepID=A0ABT9Y988_9FIRM|nr:AraC family transcriptional regulator [Pectinatus haikarae]MDQ0204309.1 AraC-like DNA-binding protein [Pectinatus haikarae]
MSVQTIELMVKWIENNITEKPSLQSMSSYIGYSPYYCSTNFRRHMGMTYKQFLVQCKLKAAAYDLCVTNDRITDIAFRYGYLSSEAFARAFSQAFQCSPRQYRKACGNFSELTPAIRYTASSNL